MPPQSGNPEPWMQQPRNVAFRINQANNQIFTGAIDAARRAAQEQTGSSAG